MLLRLRVQHFAQHVQRGRTDVAGHAHRVAGPLAQLAHHAGDGGLAVGAGDGDDLGLVAPLVPERLEGLGEQLDLAPHGDVASGGGRHDVGQFAVRRQPGADGHEVHAVEQRGAERAGHKAGIGHGGAQRGQALGRLARVGHAHARAAAGQPQRHRQAGFPQPQYQCGFTVVDHQRSFRVVSPTRTSIIVIIQNRTTTWVSFQPFCSKWWCSGAIRNTRRPTP